MSALVREISSDQDSWLRQGAGSALKALVKRLIGLERARTLGAVARRLLRLARARTRLWLAWGFGAYGGYWDARMRYETIRGDRDMYDDPGEKLYGELYLESIFDALPARTVLRILDAGCQCGRIAIPLARAGHKVTGVDITIDWINRCRAHCAEAGVHVDLICAELAEALSQFAPGSFDAIVCTEMLYVTCDFETMLRKFRALLQPHGRLIASHKTPYAMATTLVRYRKFAAAANVLTTREGVIQGMYFNWFDEDQLKDIYSKAGFSLLSTRGIGALSGRWIDGLSGIVSPNELTAEESAELLRLERLAAVPFRNMARYLLVVAEPAQEAR